MSAQTVIVIITWAAYLYAAFVAGFTIYNIGWFRGFRTACLAMKPDEPRSP